MDSNRSGAEQSLRRRKWRRGSRRAPLVRLPDGELWLLRLFLLSLQASCGAADDGRRRAAHLLCASLVARARSDTLSESGRFK